MNAFLPPSAVYPQGAIKSKKCAVGKLLSTKSEQSRERKAQRFMQGFISGDVCAWGELKLAPPRPRVLINLNNGAHRIVEKTTQQCPSGPPQRGQELSVWKWERLSQGARDFGVPQGPFSSQVWRLGASRTCRSKTLVIDFFPSSQEKGTSLRSLPRVDILACGLLRLWTRESKRWMRVQICHKIG